MLRSFARSARLAGRCCTGCAASRHLPRGAWGRPGHPPSADPDRAPNSPGQGAKPPGKGPLRGGPGEESSEHPLTRQARARIMTGPTGPCRPGPEGSRGVLPGRFQAFCSRYGAWTVILPEGTRKLPGPAAVGLPVKRHPNHQFIPFHQKLVNFYPPAGITS